MTDLGKHYRGVQQRPMSFTRAGEEAISRLLASTVPAMNVEEIMAEANKHRADTKRYTESEDGLMLGCQACDVLLAMSDFEDHRLRIAIEMALTNKEG